ncbi:MAG: DinB family protein [Vicinamibacterales bacterium]
MTTVAAALPLSRILAEGWGPGAWYGPDLKAALSGVDDALALWRPAAGRHNIAEVALHHAFYLREVVRRLTGTEPEPFDVTGEDWFVVQAGAAPSWTDVQAVVAKWQARVEQAVADQDEGRASSPLSPEERAALVLGITGHAIYHAGQVQLVKALRG